LRGLHLLLLGDDRLLLQVVPRQRGVLQHLKCSRYRVQGFGVFGVERLALEVECSGVDVQCLGFSGRGLGFSVWGLVFGIEGLLFGV
jgi:hypothetical protein